MKTITTTWNVGDIVAKFATAVIVALLAVLVFFLRDFYGAVQKDAEARRIFETQIQIKAQAIEGKVDSVVADVRRIEREQQEAKKEFQRFEREVGKKLDGKQDKK